MKRKRSKNSEYIDELTEWQENQYNPGYYTDGKIPTYMKRPGRSRKLGWLYIFSGIITCSSMLLMILISFDIEQILMISIFILLVGALAVIQVVAGIRILSETKKKKGRRIYLSIMSHWKLIIVILIVIISLSVIYKSNEQIDKIHIYTYRQIVLVGNNNSHYVTVKEIGKDLKCSNEYVIMFRALIVAPESAHKNFWVYYKWNKLFPNSGIIIKIEEMD